MENLEKLSTDELIRKALEGETVEAQSIEDYEEMRWEYVTVLHQRGSRDVLDAAAKLCDSIDAEEKRLGIDILAQLGMPERAFPEDVLCIIYRLLDNEKDPELLLSMLVAIGHSQPNDDDTNLDMVVALKNSPDADVRFGVVQALSGHKDDASVKTMLEMMKDEDEEVRDWATFGVGSLIDTDNATIREALWARLTDKDEDAEISDEALVGLARRKDDRVYEILADRFADDDWDATTLDFEAAGELGDPRLLPTLRGMFETAKEDLEVDENWLAVLVEVIEDLEKTGK